MQSRVTGQRFNATSEAAQDIEDRELKAQMEGLGLREPFVLGGVAKLVIKRVENLLNKKVNIKNEKEFDDFFKESQIAQDLLREEKEKIFNNWLLNQDEQTIKNLQKLDKSTKINPNMSIEDYVYTTDLYKEEMFDSPTYLKIYKDNPILKKIDELEDKIINKEIDYMVD